jgi:putative phosphoribosyl transferase
MRYKDDDPVVLALPRGGVPVGFEIARALEEAGAARSASKRDPARHVPLDVFLVRKLGLPGHEELAVGAIASGGVRVLNSDVVGFWGVDELAIDMVAERELKELERREKAYRDDRPMPPIEGRTVILVDDGLATGASMLAAIKALRRSKPKRIVVAVPVAPEAACRELRAHADEVVCAATPEPFFAVGAWYDDFSQTTDEEVRRLLEQASHEHVA